MFFKCSTGREIVQYHGNRSIPIGMETQYITMELEIIVIGDPKRMSQYMSYFSD